MSVLAAEASLPEGGAGCRLGVVARHDADPLLLLGLKPVPQE